MLTIETAFASEPGYTLTEAYQTAAVTVDGKWTAATEWSDAYILPMVGTTLGANGIWARSLLLILLHAKSWRNSELGMWFGKSLWTLLKV